MIGIRQLFLSCFVFDSLGILLYPDANVLKLACNINIRMTIYYCLPKNGKLKSCQICPKLSRSIFDMSEIP